MCGQDASIVPKCSYFTPFLARSYEPATWIFHTVNHQHRARKALLACGMDVYSEIFLSLLVLLLTVCFCSQIYLFWVSEWQVIDLPLICQHVESPAQKCDVFSVCLCVGKWSLPIPCCSGIELYWLIPTFLFVMGEGRSSCSGREESQWLWRSFIDRL